MASVSEQPKSKDSGELPRKARRTGLKLIGLLILTAGIAFAAVVYGNLQKRVSTDDATVEGHVSAVSSKVSGTVIEVLVRDNQQVKAGDVVLRLDPRDYQTKVRQARAVVAQAESQARAATAAIPWANESTQSGVAAATAQLADANAELERARINVELASGSELAIAQANVRSKEASNQRAQADLVRMKSLVDKEEISRQQFDAYTAAARVAESELQGARERLASSGKDITARQAALAAAQTRVQQAQALVENSVANRKQVPIRTADAGTASAAVEAARARLEEVELQLSYCTVFAPVGGLVTRKNVEPGNITGPGQSLFALIPLDSVWVVANFKETQLAQVRPGQRAELHVDMYGRTVHGRVDSISSATGARLSLLPAENATGNFVKVVQRIPVKILIDPTPDLILRPGMNVEAVIYVR